MPLGLSTTLQKMASHRIFKQKYINAKMAQFLGFIFDYVFKSLERFVKKQANGKNLDLGQFLILKF